MANEKRQERDCRCTDQCLFITSESVLADRFDVEAGFRLRCNLLAIQEPQVLVRQRALALRITDVTHLWNEIKTR